MSEPVSQAVADHSQLAIIVDRYLVRPVDSLTGALGNAIAWLTIMMAVLTFALVVVRYLLKLNSIALQESVIYMHSLVFLLGIGFTLKADEHVRVDIFYRGFSAEKKAWIDCIGNIIFLLPLCGFLFFISYEFVASSWQDLEGSSEPGGLPAVFLLKTLILIAAITIGMQTIALTLRNILFLLFPTVYSAAFSIDQKPDEHAL